MIKAIETKYKGYRFRSRLEARWAVFFDELNIKYKYEEYGFEKEGCKWLPDFYLPDSGTWVEVKGGIPSKSDCEKMSCILDYGSPLPFFDDSDIDDSSLTIESRELMESMGGKAVYHYSSMSRGVLLLGEIPNVDFGIVLHPIIRHRKGLVRKYIHFTGGLGLKDCGPQIINNDGIYIICLFSGESIKTDEYMDGMDYYEGFFTPNYYNLSTKRAYPNVCKAYQKARSARFEHGETP